MFKMKHRRFLWVRWNRLHALCPQANDSSVYRIALLPSASRGKQQIKLTVFVNRLPIGTHASGRFPNTFRLSHAMGQAGA